MTARSVDDPTATAFREELRAWLATAVPERWRRDRATLSPDEVYYEESARAQAPEGFGRIGRIPVEAAAQIDLLGACCAEGT